MTLSFILLIVGASGQIVPDKDMEARQGSNGKWGFVVKGTSDWVIQPRFEEVWNKFETSYIMARAKEGGKWGFIDCRGNFVVQPRFEDLWFYVKDNDLLVRAKENGKWGMIDRAGNFVIKPEFEDIEFNFSKVQYLAYAKYNGKYGYIDMQSKTVIPFRYDGADYFVGNHTPGRVKSGGKWGVIDWNGDMLTPFKFADASKASDDADSGDGKAKATRKKAAGEYNVVFAKLEKARNDAMAAIQSSAATAQTGGQTSTSAQAALYDTGTVLVRKQGGNGKWGFVVEGTSTWAIQPRFEDVYDKFDKSYFMVRAREGGKYGFIDRAGNFVVQPRFENLWFDVNDDYLLVKAKENGKWGYIDLQGNFVIQPRFEDMEPSFTKDQLLSYACENGKYGYIDMRGNTVIPFKYDDATYFVNDFMPGRVKSGGKWGVIDWNGNMLIQFKYTDSGTAHTSVSSGGEARIMSDRKKASGEYDAVFGRLRAAKEQVLAQVGSGGGTGGAKSINQPKSPDPANTSFSYYARGYVQERINQWQLKGEFEKTADWQVRVNETTRNARIAALTKEAEQNYIKERSRLVSFAPALKEYDADNEVYLIKDDRFGDMLVPVPIAKAQDFKARWSAITVTPRFFVDNDQLALAELAFNMPGGEAYRYSNSASLNYAVAEIDYNFAPIEIDSPTSGGVGKGKQDISTTTVTAGRSDVDVNIPVSGTRNDRTFAVIISNENYMMVSRVPMSLNDGRVFAQYCEKTLGLPKSNIRAYYDATYGVMLEAIKDIKAIAAAHNGNIDIIFYYSGHGIPDEQTREAYLLPVDASGSGNGVCYPLRQLHKELGDTGASLCTVFLDACFSGTQRDGTMLASARGVAVKARASAPQSNTVVFAASSEDQTALPYTEKGHGLFTYYLLKKLQESRGYITLGELGNYIVDNVRRQSVVINRKNQTPEVTVSAAAGESWKSRKLK